eukprot:GSMAST32.ASY1.ANO1.202.1 assembled CDS
MNRKVVELTGDHTPDQRALKEADILIATPEKWDGISRSWQRRGYVKKVGLVIIDEIHLLGADLIVSRMRYIGIQTNTLVRIVGLSTALANAQDLADWLGVNRMGLFNFKPSVRPVPLETHISGFPGKHYCPRMATMNKPTYAAIRTHSPTKPVIVFVASRRQTRLTALELIALAAIDDSRQFIEIAISKCRDSALKQTLAFGVGIHHAGLSAKDRCVVEELFLNNKIQVLCCTSTLAWGVNFPAHLVVIKGTEYFDGKTHRYIDFPITDILQMMGRAGRPQFDNHGVACILTHAPKKNFLKRFLYDPFPVESSLIGSLPDHFNAEIAGGTIQSRNDAVDYLTWTFLFRRILQNPSYYNLDDATPSGMRNFLFELVDNCLVQLENSGCSKAEGKASTKIMKTTLGLVASYYYISHTSVGLFDRCLSRCEGIIDIVRLLSDAYEYEELPLLPWDTEDMSYESPHTKAFILLQAHMKRLPLPIADYTNDTRPSYIKCHDRYCCRSRVFENYIRNNASFAMFSTSPNANTKKSFKSHDISLRDMMALDAENVEQIMQNAGLRRKQVSDICKVIQSLPNITLQWCIKDMSNPNNPKTLCESNGINSIEFQFCVQLTIKNSKSVKEIYAPKWKGQKKECGWWLVLGCGNDLLALKRIRMNRNSTTANVIFELPSDEYNNKGFEVHNDVELKLNFVADSMCGLNQEHLIPIRILF